MRLDLDSIAIEDICFGNETEVTGGVLHIDRAGLRALLLEDRRLAEVSLEIARPGERCRIVRVLDVIEPRAKTSLGDVDFPGVVGGHGVAGKGRTCALKNAAVVVCDYRDEHDASRSTDPNGRIIDMWGPAAEAGLFGKTHNLVVLPSRREGVSTQEYLIAAKAAGLKAAAYLGRAGQGVTPDATEVFELAPLSERQTDRPDLPKVVYIFQILSLQFDPIPGEPVLYGDNVPGMVPTLLHPNELLDGAVTSQFPSLNLTTYQIQNHPIIRELYARHGKALCFAGVIAMTAPNNMRDIHRVSNMAATLAKYVVGADGAILTKTGGGAPELTMAKTAQRCEQLGIRTCLAVLHMAADMSDAKHDAATLFNMPEVDAIVSLGVPHSRMAIPTVDRLLGRGLPVEGAPPIDSATTRGEGDIAGVHCQVGTSPIRAVRY
jgi:glycine reductase complex component B subunit alpha and beta